MRYSGILGFQSPEDRKERIMERFQDESLVVGLDSEGFEMDLWSLENPELNAAGPHKVFKDAIAGQVLDPQLVRLVRKEELAYFESKGV